MIDRIGRMRDTLKGTVAVETLAATRTLLVTDYMIQWLDPGGADRDVNLPAEASSTNLLFIILNTADGAGEDLVVKNAAAAVKATLGPGMMGMFSCDGTSWNWENNSGVYYDNERGYLGIGHVDPQNIFHVVAKSANTYVARFAGSRPAASINAMFEHTGVANLDNQVRFEFRQVTSAQSRTTFEFQTGLSVLTDALRTSFVNFATCVDGVFGTQMTLLGDKFGIGTETPAGIIHTILSATQPALFGGDEIKSVTTVSVTNAAKTIMNEAGIETSVNIGDLVILTSGTEAITGSYRVTNVALNQITVDRACKTDGGDQTDYVVTIVKDVVLIDATDSVNGQRIMNYSHQNKPLQIGGDTLLAPSYVANTGQSPDVQIGRRLIIPLANSPATPTLAFGDGDSGFYEGADDVIYVSLVGASKYYFTATFFGSLAIDGATFRQTGVSATVPGILFGTDIDTGIGRAGTDQLSLIAGGVEGIRVGVSDNTFNGGQKVHITTVNAATYDLLVTDYILHVVYTATGSVAIDLPTAQCVAGRIFSVKDAGYNAGVNSITLDTEGAEKINNADTYIINASGDAIDVYSDGTNWHVK